MVTPKEINPGFLCADKSVFYLLLGGDVNAQASNGDTVLYDASGSGNLDCIKLLLLHGANPNVASYACQLPIHRAAYEGHIL